MNREEKEKEIYELIEGTDWLGFDKHKPGCGIDCSHFSIDKDYAETLYWVIWGIQTFHKRAEAIEFIHKFDEDLSRIINYARQLPSLNVTELANHMMIEFRLKALAVIEDELKILIEELEEIEDDE